VKVLTVLSRARRRLLPIVYRVALERSSPRELCRLGTPYGGWWVPSDLLQPGNVAYCGGVGEDASFDLELADRGVLVWAFDPTPKAIAYAATLRDRSNFHFEPVGWFDAPDVLRFYVPLDPSHASYSAANLQGSSEYVEAQVDTVANCARRLGHQHVHVVKMDIEGLAHEVVASILKEGPTVDCLCVEFDQPSSNTRLVGTVRLLRRHGYRVAKIEGWNYTFLRVT